jgi:hypothetical protein
MPVILFRHDGLLCARVHPNWVCLVCNWHDKSIERDHSNNALSYCSLSALLFRVGGGVGVGVSARVIVGSSIWAIYPDEVASVW